MDRTKGTRNLVRNQINLSLPPEDLFLNPWQDPGFWLLVEPEFIWRPIAKAQISGFPVSADAETNRRLHKLIRGIRRGNNFSEAIEYNSVPVVLESATFRKSSLAVHDKFVLSGATGTRLINRFLWSKAEDGIDAEAMLDAYFSKCRESNEGKEIPVYSGLLETDINFAIPCRNAFNYYHFITESLCQLTLLDGLEFQGNIYFHFPHPQDRSRAFTKHFVEALFPELADRVFFERSPKAYAKVLSSYDLVGGHTQAPDAESSEVETFAPEALKKKGGTRSVATRRPFAANTVNSSLIALRNRALRAIEDHDFDHLPKRFFVGRNDEKSRSRHMEGQEELFESLEPLGFAYVVFEDLSPLEQIAIMSNAEMMISYHGAGFTNMLFANPKAYVIEIGTIQTAEYRWGDFWPLAHVSGCKFINFFADLRQDNLAEQEASDTGGLFSASLSQSAIEHISTFIGSVFGMFPELKSSDKVSTLARQLLEAGAAQQAIELVESHDLMTATDVNLCLLKADCHKALDEAKSELLTLDAAFKADPSRSQTLVRIIWCANACDRPQVIRWAVSRLKADFPEHHDEFLGKHAWLRYVA